MGIGSAITALVSGCSGAQVLDHLVAHDTYHGPTGVRYGADPRHLLDVYQPDSGTVPGNAPVVLFFYGGNWTRGERAEYRFVGEALAANGIIAVVADYRLSPHVCYDGFLGDCALALQWTLSHAVSLGGDPARVMVMGHSAGAYNAAMLALDPRWLAPLGLTADRLAGWIGLAGPYDFLPIENPAVRPVFFWPNSPPQSQPINHVSRDAPPALLIAASKDDLVNPTRNTGGLAHKLRAAGVPVQDFYYSRPNHITLVATLSRPLRGLAPVLDQVVGFIRHTPTQ